jgi:hypothetical protein
VLIRLPSISMEKVWKNLELQCAHRQCAELLNDRQCDAYKQADCCSKTMSECTNLYYHQAEPCPDFNYFRFCAHQTPLCDNKALCAMSTEYYSSDYVYAHDIMPHTSRIFYHNTSCLSGGGRRRYPNSTLYFSLHETLTSQCVYLVIKNTYR